MPPAKGEQTSVPALLQGSRHIGYRDAHTNDLVIGRVPVFNQTEHIHIEHGEPHLQILVNLTLRHLRIAVEMAKRLVNDIEHLTAILFLAEHLTALGVHGMQVVALHHHLRHFAELLGHALLRHDELVFHIIIVLHPAPQLLHMQGIVSMVIDSGHRTQLVETFDEHALRIHIREAQRTNNFRHTLRASPFGHCIQKGT